MMTVAFFAVAWFAIFSVCSYSHHAIAFACIGGIEDVDKCHLKRQVFRKTMLSHAARRVSVTLLSLSTVAPCRRANIASIVGSEDACECLAAALAGVDGVTVAEELLPYVVRAVVLQPYASAKLVGGTLPIRRCPVISAKLHARLGVP